MTSTIDRIVARVRGEKRAPQAMADREEADRKAPGNGSGNGVQGAGDVEVEPKPELPELIIHRGNLPATAADLRDRLAQSGRLFDRGLPVRVVRPADGGMPSATPLTRHNVVIEAHRLCQPDEDRCRWHTYPS